MDRGKGYLRRGEWIDPETRGLCHGVKDMIWSGGRMCSVGGPGVGFLGRLVNISYFLV